MLAAQHGLPVADPPATPEPLYQEKGTRPSRALPYELHASARIGADGTVQLLFGNTGRQGAVFHVYDRKHLNLIPRRYTVEAGKLLDDVWTGAATTDAGQYDLWVYGTNGFVRTFKGDTAVLAASSFKPEVQVCYQPEDGQVYVKVHNGGSEAGSVTVTSNAYRTDGPWTLEVPAGDVAMLHWGVADSGNWYDFTVSGSGFERRFAGRMENGKPSVSDPLMAAHL